MEMILSSGKKLGLLPGCNHIFCLECLRVWRTGSSEKARENARLCPLCRKTS